MRTKVVLSVLATAGLLAVGCSSKNSANDSTSLTGSASNSASAGSSGASGNTSANTSAGTTSAGGTFGTGGGGSGGSTGGASSATGTGGSGGGVFLITPDGGGADIECSVWDQDCMPGQKCMPWANDGGNSWNATKCTPLDPMPAQPGDSCTVQGSGVSGVDNCDVASMCWNVDPMTNMGTCVAFCTGSDANPVCDDPMTSCSIANDGTLILCLPSCDPLLQDCSTGQGCYPINDGFVCAPDAGGDGMGAYGDPCEYLNVCDPGLACLDSSAVPNCTGSSGCCSPFCDTSDPNSSMNCPGNSGGQMCTPAFQMGMAPPGYENVGFCAIPA